MAFSLATQRLWLNPAWFVQLVDWGRCISIHTKALKTILAVHMISQELELARMAWRLVLPGKTATTRGLPYIVRYKYCCFWIFHFFTSFVWHFVPLNLRWKQSNPRLNLKRSSVIITSKSKTSGWEMGYMLQQNFKSDCQQKNHGLCFCATVVIGQIVSLRASLVLQCNAPWRFWCTLCPSDKKQLL